jgi:hypothetical protein
MDTVQDIKVDLKRKRATFNETDTQLLLDPLQIEKMHRQRRKSDGVCGAQRILHPVAVEGDNQDCLCLHQSRVEKNFRNQADQPEAVLACLQHDGDESRSNIG